jgi:predicted hydrocarbon binding protein
LCRKLVSQTFKGSRASTRLRKGAGTLSIRASIFCAVRERAAHPMCGFYRAAIERFLQRFDLDAAVDLTQCKASGGSGCTMAVTIRGERAEEPAAEAA